MQRSGLIVGASRGLGWGLACELVRQGWRVVGTVRDTQRHTRLHELKQETRHTVEIEQVDIAIQADIASLRARLAGERFDLLFVVAGVTNDIGETISRVTTQAFLPPMLPNALPPLPPLTPLTPPVLPPAHLP